LFIRNPFPYNLKYSPKLNTDLNNSGSFSGGTALIFYMMGFENERINTSFIRVAREPFDISDREVKADEGVDCRGREAGEGVLVVDDPPFRFSISRRAASSFACKFWTDGSGSCNGEFHQKTLLFFFLHLTSHMRIQFFGFPEMWWPVSPAFGSQTL